MKTLITATLVILGGAIHLSRPSVAEAMIPCTAENAEELCDTLLFIICGTMDEGSCSFGCSGGEITYANVHCAAT